MLNKVENNFLISLIIQSIFCEVSQNTSKETDSKACEQEEDIMWTNKHQYYLIRHIIISSVALQKKFAVSKWTWPKI